MATKKRLNQYMRNVIVEAVMKDVPVRSADDIAADIQAAFYAAMSPDLIELEKIYPNSLRTHSYGGDYGLGYPYREFVVANLTGKQIEAVLQPFDEAQSAHHEARTKLKNALAGMRTEDDVRKHFPELEKYLTDKPIESTNLPALANVMADLAKLGWPKSKK